ncbi:YpiB family protein [Anaerobacillus sp. MEB173]|uniref:YpiB family protein n=1 Tax=Anaerobacillus sp. MEB173 TaxID=3383345 RepID=UPI003F8E7E34
MNNWVGIKEKKSFLKWFLNNHRLKRSDAKYLLEYLITNSHILENIIFTDEFRRDRKTIVISSLNSDQIGFEYYTNNKKTDDVSRAVKDMMYNPTEKIHLMLHFFGKMMNQKYLSIVGNPALENVRRYRTYEKISKEAEHLLTDSLDKNKVRRLLAQIDQALDNKDEELFQYLSQELKKLKRN